MTFLKFWPDFIAQKEIVAKHTTICAYKLQWRTHLSNCFSNVEIESVRNSTLQKYVNDNLLAGRNVKCVRDEITLIKNIIKTYSILNDVACYMPVVVWPSKAKTIPQKRREKYTDEEINKIVNFCRDSPEHWHKLIALSCVTGVRIGEAAGLQFRDFDFDAETIHISRTVGRLYDEPMKSEIYINTTKTACSNRVVPIPGWLCDYYKKYQDLYNFPNDTFITQGDRSSFIEPRTLRAKFRTLCKRVGVEYKSFHSLRHTYASKLLLSGVDAVTAASLLGHSDVAMTLNVYSHTDDSAKRKAAQNVFL